jgi:hypothetical protein
MARKNDYGKFIIAAGEVGSYVVCPEAWRLAQIKKVKPVPSRSMRKGTKLHNKWDEEVTQVRKFSRSIRISAWLLLIATTFFAVKYFIIIPSVGQ